MCAVLSSAWNIFICISRDKYEAAQDSPIFEVPSLPRLTSEHLAKLMKATATLLGLPADKVSAHSLRYGGATMLAAAGFPEYVIANYGGWAEGSQSLRRYSRPTTEMITKVSEQPHVRAVQRTLQLGMNS